MEAKAACKYLRISPRKTRLVVDLVRGKKASGCLEILEAMNKRAARVVNKVLASAVANARQKELDVDSLWIKKITVDGGPVYKRYMPRAMGRATMIKKPTSHITIILSDGKEEPEIKEEVRKVAEKKKIKKPRIGRRRKKEMKEPKKAKRKQKNVK